MSHVQLHLPSFCVVAIVRPHFYLMAYFSLFSPFLLICFFPFFLCDTHLHCDRDTDTTRLYSDRDTDSNKDLCLQNEVSPCRMFVMLV